MEPVSRKECMKSRLVLVFALFQACAVPAARCEPEKTAPVFDPISSYESRTLAGFTVLVNRKALAHESATHEALDLLGDKLAEVGRILSPQQLKPLRDVRVWVERDQTDGGAQYHVSAGWLKDNGYNPEKAG